MAATTPPPADHATPAALRAPWPSSSMATACRTASASDDLFMNLAPIEIDHAALAAFESPSFNEAEAIDLDACSPCAWDTTPASDRQQQQTQRMVDCTGRTHHETSFQALLQSTDFVFHAPVALDRRDSDGTADYFSYHHDDQDDDSEEEEALDLSDPRNRCSYRKGKCDQQRTRKADGRLHTYCTLHRLRSIENQRQFDAKRRKGLTSTKHRTSTSSSRSISSESTKARHHEDPQATAGQPERRLAEKRVTRASVRAASLPGVL